VPVVRTAGRPGQRVASLAVGDVAACPGSTAANRSCATVHPAEPIDASAARWARARGSFTALGQLSDCEGRGRLSRIAEVAGVRGGICVELQVTDARSTATERCRSTMADDVAGVPCRGALGVGE
jgi:hypothetical protein